MKFVLLSMCILFSSRNNFVNAQPSPAIPEAVKKQLAKTKAANIKQAATTQLQYFVIKAGESTYGYDIYANGKLYIHQATIPAVSGTRGFADTASASATARWAIKKIRQGELPPTITVSELKKLKVIMP